MSDDVVCASAYRFSSTRIIIIPVTFIEPLLTHTDQLWGPANVAVGGASGTDIEGSCN